MLRNVTLSSDSGKENIQTHLIYTFTLCTMKPAGINIMEENDKTVYREILLRHYLGMH